MSFNGTMYGQSDVFHSQQTPQQYSYQPAQTHLNPSVPRFQPSGMELQRYSQEPMAFTPPMTPDLSLRQYSGTQVTHELSQLGRQTQQNSADIAEIRDAVGRDLRKLQRQFSQANPAVGGQMPMAAINQGPEVLDIQVVSPKAMMERFGCSITAQIYLEQAKVFEDQAAQMRKTVRELCPDHDVKGREVKLLEAPESNGSDTLGIDSPTHAPARRSQTNDQPGAVQAQAQEKTTTLAVQDAATQTGKQEQNGILSHKTEPTPTNPSVVWQPLPVRSMKPFILPTSSTTTNPPTFTWEFLKMTLRGEQWSPGFYFISPKHQTPSTPPSHSYWILDTSSEPFLPSGPGQHGAKLTAFFNNTFSDANDAPIEENYMRVPVFIARDPDQKEYVYHGHYSQSRFSDRLDHDRILTTVPAHVRSYWATQFADKKNRPEWVTQELMAHFWPKPSYLGPMPTDSAISTPATTVSSGEKVEKRVMRALEAYAEELKRWEKEARMKVGMLTEEVLFEAFEKADADEEPGLRLWWEYLECVGFEEEFVEGLEALKGKGIGKKPANISLPVVAGPSKKLMVVSTADSPASTTPPTTVIRASASTKVVSPAIKDTKGKSAQPPTGPSKGPQGDLALAKQMSAEFKDGKGAHKRGGGNRGGAGAGPPHLRRRS